MAQQTAVEWLIEKIHKNMGVWIPPHIQDQAKAMEKEQIINADLNATIRTAKGANSDVSVRRVKELAEEYYNENYNK
jgi:hypothetical protein